jgi:hypothetical protein
MVRRVCGFDVRPNQHNESPLVSWPHGSRRRVAPPHHEGLALCRLLAPRPEERAQRASRRTGHAKNDDTTSRSRGAWRPSFFIDLALRNRGRREDRVPFAPMVRVQQKKHAAEPQVRAEQPAFPAQWCYGLYVLSPVTRLCCHRHRRDAKHPRRLDASPGASGPHDFAVRVVPFVSQHIASIASRAQRP